MKNKLIKTALAAGIAALSLFMFICGGAMLGEGYNIFAPYADTEMAKDYTPDKFDNIKEGMSIAEIRKITGEPLFTSIDSVNNLFIHNYTRDGLLMKKKESWFPLAGDLAWYGSSVEYNRDSIAVKVFKSWYYD